MKLLFFLILSLSCAIEVSAKSEVREILFMSDAAKEIEKQVDRHGVKNVLVVFDLDSTLLSLNQDLGSDYWFTWQNSKIKTGDTLDRIANNITDLFAAQLQLYTLSKMHSPETTTPEFVTQLQNQGISVMVLTSRMTDFRDITEKHLSDNRINMKLTQPIANHDSGDDYAPYDPSRPQDYGLESSDLALADQKSIPRVNYKRGVYLTAGLHKGLALKSFLGAKVKRDNYRAIVFVDDRPHHCKAVADVYQNSLKDVVSLRYGHEDANIEAFNSGTKAAAIDGYQQFMKLKENVFH